MATYNIPLLNPVPINELTGCFLSCSWMEMNLRADEIEEALNEYWHFALSTAILLIEILVTKQHRKAIGGNGCYPSCYFPQEAKAIL